MKKILNWLHLAATSICRIFYKYVKMAVLITIVSFVVVAGIWEIWLYNMEKIKYNVPSVPATPTLLSIHSKIAKVTDVSNRVPPIAMLATMDSFFEVNAFTTGKGVYFTFKADNALTEDEKALIMGHEIAHVILHHTDTEYQTFVYRQSNEDELMADNLGATWAHKAGYDVCKGREIFNKFYEWGGNSLNASHPPNTYRYENLAHYCGGV